MREHLYEKLYDHGKSDIYPFHMPGHKRNIEYVGEHLSYNKDITEIWGFDDLHHAEGIIAEMEKMASEIFKSDVTHCLVNGSTVGNIAAILGCTTYGDKILIARNCHNSIHTAITLNNLEPIYVYPETISEYGICGEVIAKDIESILKIEENIRAVVIVSPTYEGVISDIKEIAKVTGKYQVPLIVDEAHGAHLGLNSFFHNNSNENGADIVIHSIHKTLPALTQCALIHLNGQLVDKKKVKKYLQMLQTSSPSYILMASISRCLELIEADNLKNTMEEYIENLETTRNKLKSMRNLSLIETNIYDKGKIVISTNGSTISSRKIFELLRSKYKLELEMDGMNYVIAMTSIADTAKGFERLTKAFLEIDAALVNDSSKYDITNDNDQLNTLDKYDSIYREQKAFHEHMEMKRKINERKKSIAEIFVEEGISGTGEISESYYYLYPPGIPLIVPGETVTEKHKILMETYKRRGYIIRKN